MKKIFLMAALMTAFGANCQINVGLLAQYDFNGNADDISGNGHHGIVSGAQLGDDRFGNPQSAYFFDGLNDKITVPGFPTNYSEYSICAWVRMPAFFFVPWGGIVYQLGETPVLGAQHGAMGLNVSQFSFRYSFEHVDSGETENYLVDNVDIDSNWHFLVATYDGYAVRFYNDNVLKAIDSISTSITKKDTLLMGCRSINNFYHWYRGFVDDVMIFNRPINQSEMDSLYNNLVELPELASEPKELVRIYDLYGRETEDKPNTTLIYLYSDGTTEKVFRAMP